MMYIQMPDSSDTGMSISSAKVAIFGEICYTLISVRTGVA